MQLLKVLNIQGLNESCYNYNYEILKEGYVDVNIFSYDIDLKSIKPAAFIHDCMLQEYDCVVANCFGGFYGYIIGSLQHIPTILINPMIPPTEYMRIEYPQYKFINQLDDLWDKYKQTNKQITLFLGDTDVTIDINRVSSIDNYKSIIRLQEDGHIPTSRIFEDTLKEKLKYYVYTSNLKKN